MNNKSRFHLFYLMVPLAVCLLFFAGCETAPQTDAPPQPRPDAVQLLQRYNARARKVSQIWSRAVVELQWTDSKNKKHSEQGDGYLVARKPGSLFMTAGTKAVDAPWVVLGGDTRRFWFFDLHPPDDQPTVVYFGRHVDLDKTSMSQLGMPARADLLIQLLGLHELPLPTGDPPTITPVKENDYSAAWYRFPLKLSNQSLEQAVLIETRTAQPRAIRFTDAEGAVVAESKLSEYEPIPLKETPPGSLPLIATRIEIAAPANKARITLHLSGVNPEKVTDAQFDFDKLVQRYKPARRLVLREK